MVSDSDSHTTIFLGGDLAPFSREALPIVETHMFAVIQNWGSELSERGHLVSEFLDSLNTFSSSLLSAKDNMNNHLVLAETEYTVQLDSMRTAADYRAASK